MSAQEIRVPDIGDFSDVEIIEVLVGPGDNVAAEDSLITLESDKASMEIPSPSAGTVKELRVQVGDRVSEGDVILLLDGNGASADAGAASEARRSERDSGERGNGQGDEGSGAVAAPRADAAGTDAGAGADATAAGGSVEVRVPDIGDFSDVEVIEVLVQPGDTVAAEDSLITLESDKASMEIPSSDAGKVEKLHVQLGDRVSAGDLIATLSGAGSAPATTPVTADTASADTASAGKAAADAASAAAPEAAARRQSPTAHIDDTGFKKAHASPAVRRFARELGTDLAMVPGSGPKGRILREDVKAFVKQAMAGAFIGRGAAPGAGGGAAIPAMPEIDFSKWGEVDVQALGRIRKISGAHLHRAWLNVPHVTHHDEADVTELEAFRQSLKDEVRERGVRVTALAFIMKALAGALREFPRFNASLSADQQHLVMKKYFHIGIAVDTPNGLVVPVFRDVDRKSIYDLAQEMADISARARDGKLKPDELQGGCMSISSLGGIGGTAFTPIVNAPEVAILGVTRARMTPVWNGKEFTPRLMLPLDLSFDHRVIDGAEAARFVSWLCRALGDVRRLLL